MRLPFASTPKDETNEGISASIDDPDTMLTMIVLLLACPRAAQSWRMQLFSNAREQPYPGSALFPTCVVLTTPAATTSPQVVKPFSAAPDTLRIAVGLNALDSVDNRSSDAATGEQRCLAILRPEFSVASLASLSVLPVSNPRSAPRFYHFLCHAGQNFRRNR